MHCCPRSLLILALLAFSCVGGCGKESTSVTSKSELENFMEQNPDLAVEMDDIPDDPYGGASVEDIE